MPRHVWKSGRSRLRSISICKLTRPFARRERVNWSSLLPPHSLPAVVPRETVANLICTNNTIVSPRRGSSGEGRRDLACLRFFAFSRVGATIPIMAGHFRLNAREGEGKEPRGKSTPVAHCRVCSLLTACGLSVLSSPFSLSFSHLLWLSCVFSRALRQKSRAPAAVELLRWRQREVRDSRVNIV